MLINDILIINEVLKSRTHEELAPLVKILQELRTKGIQDESILRITKEVESVWIIKHQASKGLFHKKFKVLKPNHLCLYRNKELGIAGAGYFASSAWKKGDAAFKEIVGTSFGWTDSKGGFYNDPKSAFTRPTESEIKSLMTDKLFEICVKERIIEEI